MGLRCLLGCDFGEPEIEREREEKGDEVVITVNEVKTCSRCGKRRVVSENTEVTSLEQLTATADDESVDEPPAAAATEEVVSASNAGGHTAPADSTDISIDATDPATDDAELLGDDEPENLGTAEPANMTVEDVEAAAADPVGGEVTAEAADDTDAVDAAADDGVILSDEATESEADEIDGERQRGEWPEYAAGEQPTDESDYEWPAPETEDEGFSAEQPTDPPEDMTFGGGFTPEITAEEATVADGDEQLSFTRAEEASVEYEPTVDDIQTEFYCPECGLARKAGNSSMRAGDICPECKRGYISERPI